MTTAKARIEALLDSGIDEPDEALAEKAGCATSTANAYRIEWQRRHRICGQRLRIPPEAEVEVIALRNDGLTFPAVAEAIREQFDIGLTADQAATIYRSGGSLAENAPIPAEVDANDLPLETYSGLMWRLPIKPSRIGKNKRGWSTCDVCPLRSECARTLTDPLWYCGCERALVWEVPQIEM